MDTKRVGGTVEVVRAWGRQTPLADPRSLGGAILFHGLLLMVASAAALTVGTPDREHEGPKSLRAELDPVDNRADRTEGEGGGAPGSLGGDRLAAALEDVNPAASAAGRPAPA